jgi:hypothetical protein
LLNISINNMGFDMYNMSAALSDGNARTAAVENLNESIRLNNEQKIKNAKDAAIGLVGQDKQDAILSGIKDGIGEGSALSNVAGKVQAYKAAVNATPITTPGGWTEVKPTPEEISAKAPNPGEDIEGLEAAEKPSAAISTSEGTLAEGSDILSKGDKVLAGGLEVGEEVSGGAKIAGAIGRGVGVVGGLATAGLDIAADVKSFESGKGLLSGDNFGEKLANIGSIGGAALDMLGFVPGFQLAGVVGAGLQAASGVLDAASQGVHTATQIAQDKKVTPPTLDPQVAQASLAGSFANVRTD